LVQVGRPARLEVAAGVDLIIVRAIGSGRVL
jgi:hypothetical protein